MKSSLQIVDRFLLMPSMLSNARFAQNGELFARLKLVSDISEDTLQGRLILQNVFTVLLAPSDKKKQQQCGSKVRKHISLPSDWALRTTQRYICDTLSFGHSGSSHNLFDTDLPPSPALQIYDIAAHVWLYYVSKFLTK